MSPPMKKLKLAEQKLKAAVRLGATRNDCHVEPVFRISAIG